MAKANNGLVRFFRSPTAGPFVLAIAVGLGAGVGAVVFRWLITSAHDVMFGSAAKLVGGWGPYHVVPVPAIGGLIVGLLVFFFAREAKGHGVPEVMLAVAESGGRIRGRVAVVKALASAVCIGSGGSAGREGPIVQIGSSLGSSLAVALRLPVQRVRLLVACGAAAGIAATFNAPIGGAIFALEVILRDFGIRSFVLVVLSSVAATAYSRASLGDMPAFAVPVHQPASWYELPLYMVLGLLAGLAAILFSRALYAVEDLFDPMRLPEYIKPVLGGLLIGIIGVKFPHIFGVGYETIESALTGRLGTWFCLGLVFLKIIATSVSIGSGGSGGVFAPSLFIGAVLGGFFGQLLHAIMPGIVPNAEGYAICGMGAVFAGACRAPVTAVLILFEMTADYRVIVPLMASVVVSTLLAERLMREDVYTIKLVRRGINIKKARPIDPMSDVRVEDVMTTSIDTLPLAMPLEEAAAQFQRTGHHGFPVVDKEGLLAGILTLSDLERAARQGLHDRIVEDIATRDVMVCYPEQTLRSALADPMAGEVGRLPVVDPDDPRKLVGVLRRSDIVHAYTATAAKLAPPDETGPPPEDD